MKMYNVLAKHSKNIKKFLSPLDRETGFARKELEIKSGNRREVQKVCREVTGNSRKQVFLRVPEPHEVSTRGGKCPAHEQVLTYAPYPNTRTGKQTPKQSTHFAYTNARVWKERARGILLPKIATARSLAARVYRYRLQFGHLTSLLPCRQLFTEAVLSRHER